MSDLMLEGPPLPRKRCTFCIGTGRVFFGFRPARECPTCRGLGVMVDDNRPFGRLDREAYEVGLAPIGRA